MHPHPLRIFAFLLLLPLVLTACETRDEPVEPAPESVLEPTPSTPATGDTTTTASVTLEPLNDSGVQGTATFTPVEGGVRIVAHVTGLSQGAHGFHVHENGDCGNNGEAAGGHFAPQGSPHGAPDAPAQNRHVGDLGNIEATAQGEGHYERVDSVITLSGPNSIVGKALLIHAGQDDLTSQPSGDSGNRIACGIIR